MSNPYIIDICDKRKWFLTGCDGYVLFTPDRGPVFTANMLRNIAHEMDLRDSAHDKLVEDAK